MELSQLMKIHHGIMLVGPSGSGKSSCIKILSRALSKVHSNETVFFSLDPKVMSKDDLFGHMDSTTREWTDGYLTAMLRKIMDNTRGESTRDYWIVFDGDVDPEWVENLNSVLDDNKLLTLPNGERIRLPSNVHILFEVQDLKYATLATVSRCGMIFFNADVVSLQMRFKHYLRSLTLASKTLDDVVDVDSRDVKQQSVQKVFGDLIEPYFAPNGLVEKCFYKASTFKHIMDFTEIRAFSTLTSLLNHALKRINRYNEAHVDFPMPFDHMEKYALKKLILSILWAFTGDCSIPERIELGNFLKKQTTLSLPTSDTLSLIDFNVDIKSGNWVYWGDKVPAIDLEPYELSAMNSVIPTIDTMKHEDIVHTFLEEHSPTILCGPPGSGKTMTLLMALRKMPQLEIISLNFSSSSTVKMVITNMEQFCDYCKSGNDLILSPKNGKRLAIFCDEINLPAQDKYGTQRIISFLRQLIEKNGFWSAHHRCWVKVEKVQIIGACNPPTDAGRVPLAHRFLRHTPVIYVDYPTEISLKQIYGTYARAALKLVPHLRGYAENICCAMIDVYLSSQAKFTPELQVHYVYSPRELTRWIRGIYEAIKPLDNVDLQLLLKIWAHEGLRLFQDRLVEEEEKKWTDGIIDSVAEKYFGEIETKDVLRRPLLFSNWLSKNYLPTEAEELKEYIQSRLRVFYEEELNVKLVIYDELLDHILRIDRVFRQPQGHLLLIGASGTGRSTITRFVAWMNGISVTKLNIHSAYTGKDFDEDLKSILKRCATKGEKICFIMDESNMLDSGFLERMNTLLANAEIPGLFEGDELSALMAGCKELALKEGRTVETPEEVRVFFTKQIVSNLHVVFTMNPPGNDFLSKSTKSPALFNRCVLNWFGDWSDHTLYQFAEEITSNIDLNMVNSVGSTMAITDPRERLLELFVKAHASVRQTLSTQDLGKHMTPRLYMDLIEQFVKILSEKREEVEEEQRHVNVGLSRLNETVTTVEQLRKTLAIKKRDLELKNNQANEKLKSMVAGQQEAEQKKKLSLEIQKDVAAQKEKIGARQKIVSEDLSKVEPLIAEARESVSNIKKQHLTEVRSMGNPPEAVKLTLESVCILLGHKVDSWKAVQAVLRRDDFILSIVNYSTDKLTTGIRKQILSEYMSNPNFTYEVVNRASKACGPLVQWIIAQVQYSEILDKVGPLRREVQELEKGAQETERKADEVAATLNTLEAKIAQYKEEYAKLISETQTLKAEMDRVHSRVDRSVSLLDSLSSERIRWSESSTAFAAQTNHLIGDAFISSAFLAYCGFLDQSCRSSLLNQWKTLLKASDVSFRETLSLPDYLSTVDERMKWAECGLPSDQLSSENAAILKRYNRFPLIIDPSGNARNYLKSLYKSQRLTVCSFLDSSFTKVLESAVRFGNTLLVEDVEFFNPILNPVLNRDLILSGGRTLIMVGNQTVDFSPSFNVILLSKSANLNLSSDLASKMTIINFTVTRGSLQNRLLHETLVSERPEIDRKRSDFIKLQGEYQVKLRNLEKMLLSSLNECEGNILENDSVIQTLEDVKREVAVVTQKSLETNDFMEEVKAVIALYEPLANKASDTFFLLNNLHRLNHFYRLSLTAFLSCFREVLRKMRKSADTDPVTKIPQLEETFFVDIMSRISDSLLHGDDIVVSTLLSEIKERDSGLSQRPEFMSLLEQDHGTASSKELSQGLVKLVGDAVARRIQQYSGIKLFSNLESHVLENVRVWQQFLSSAFPEQGVPIFWDRKDGNLCSFYLDF